jgi:hypothetical protein
MEVSGQLHATLLLRKEENLLSLPVIEAWLSIP